MMREPDFSFNIPSLEDNLALDCRIYHPPHSDGRKGAIIAHPYAPLGGSQDDSVVLSMVEALLDEAYVVATFNFRGAGDSAGRTSWTGRPEIEDYSSTVGLLIYYLSHLSSTDELDILSFPRSGDGRAYSSAPSQSAAKQSIQLLLAGYSFGSLILARIAPVAEILRRFKAAERGSAAEEIFLRAKTLARQTMRNEEAKSITSRQRGRSVDTDDSPAQPTSRASPVTIGGEETNSAGRRSSHDKRSLDMIREVPQRFKAHIRRISGSSLKGGATSRSEVTAIETTEDVDLKVKYLLISPVLVPLTLHLLPPGLPAFLMLSTSPNKATAEGVSGQQILNHPTFAVFGSSDSFTSSNRLRQWAETMQKDSSGHLQWMQIDGAGHFWHEPGVMQALHTSVRAWLRRI